jgi:CHASE1-domain containing sensor protein
VNDVALAASGLTVNNWLAIVAALLLLFVSGGVIYLSTVEWRDRRRRQQPAVGAKGRR